MKKHFLSLFAAILLLGGLTASCNNSLGFSRATGMPYEIAVTMDEAVWESEVGEAVRADLEAEVPGLPQPEPSFRIMYAKSKDFGSLLAYVRNVLIVNVDERMYTKVSLLSEDNRWANGQVVLTLNAPDIRSAADFLNGRGSELSGFFGRIEMRRATLSMTEDFSAAVRDTLRSRFDILLNAPQDMKYTRGRDDFFWASNNAKTGRTDLVVYTFPYTDKDTFTGDYLIAKRDSVMRINMPGTFPDSYMTTEKSPGVTNYSAITVRDKYCGVLRGLWRMVGDMMGGPFVSIFRLDEANNRIVAVEGFVYAPESNKRNYIRRIEAALYTLRLPGEFELPVAEAIKGR
ncbi:MAG: DUF4837 family protein [Tannerellaceae bacterium]|jgi:hypothetical protein|nr:DUF4837 family protein [Tannerellaceae bacterium]